MNVDYRVLRASNVVARDSWFGQRRGGRFSPGRWRHER
jgi:hypothetical protein